MKRRVLIGVVISAGFLALALHDVDWVQLWQTLRTTRWPYLIPTIVLSVVGHYFRAYRWKFMLLPVKNISTSSLFSATCIGLAANNLLPARLGEIIRAFALGQREGISRTASFATIVYERIVDVFALLALLWFTLLKIDGPEWLQSAGLWILALNVLLLIVMQLLRQFPARVVRVVAGLSRPLPATLQASLDRWTTGFIAGLATINQLRLLIPIVLLSALVWGAALYGIYYCLIAAGITAPFLTSITLLVFVSLGSMIPSAPAYIGTFQYACVVGLSVFGVGKSDALAFSLIYHASQFFPITALGLFYLMRYQLRFADLSRVSD